MPKKPINPIAADLIAQLDRKLAPLGHIATRRMFSSIRIGSDRNIPHQTDFGDTSHQLLCDLLRSSKQSIQTIDVYDDRVRRRIFHFRGNRMCSIEQRRMG